MRMTKRFPLLCPVLPKPFRSSSVVVAAAVGIGLLIASTQARAAVPLIDGGQAGSYKSVPESQKGGSVHIGEGIKASEPLARASEGPDRRFESETFPQTLQCKIKTLRKLGWIVSPTLASGQQPTINSDGSCHVTTMDQIRRQRLLEVTIPANLNRAADARVANDVIDAALNDKGTYCSYETFLAPAIERATTGLFKNHAYSFANIFGSGSVRMANLKPDWEQVSCKDKDKCWQPAGAPATAMNDLYNKGFATECATGLQVAEYQSIHELFGDAEFNARFTDNELYVGDWESILPSDSVIHGASGRKVFSSTGMDYADAGPQMLVGVSGYIEHVFGKDDDDSQKSTAAAKKPGANSSDDSGDSNKYLDVPVDRGENMLIVSTSAAAAQALLKNGGLPFYNTLARRIWELGRGRDEQSLRQLLLNRKIMLSEDAATIQLRQLLNEPFLHDTIVYVHDIGFRSLSAHLVRLLEINSRTPYSIRFYAEAMHGEIFDRWLNMQLEHCDQP